MIPAFDLGELRLEQPLALLLGLAFVPGLWRRWRQGPAHVPFAPTALLRAAPRPTLGELGARLPPFALVRSWRMRTLLLPRSLSALAVLLALVALARPTRRVPLPLENEGLDLVLCLDVSSSMTAFDLDPRRDRLELARSAAIRFATERRDDRIGLITFARYPDLVCPPTLDHEALRRSLQDARCVEADGPEDRTGIGSALGLAVKVLRSSPARSKLVILLTDGVENVATAASPDEIGPLRAAQLARALGVRVDTIAAGTGTQDLDGRWIELDDRELRRTAEITGGTFHAARETGSVDAVFRAIDALQTAPFREPEFRVVESFAPFLWAAAALAFLSRLLRATVWRVQP